MFLRNAPRLPNAQSGENECCPVSLTQLDGAVGRKPRVFVSALSVNTHTHTPFADLSVCRVCFQIHTVHGARSTMMTVIQQRCHLNVLQRFFEE